MLFLDQEVLHVTVTIFLAHLVDLMAPLVSFSEYLFADFFAPQNMLHFLWILVRLLGHYVQYSQTLL